MNQGRAECSSFCGKGERDGTFKYYMMVTWDTYL